MLFTPRGARDAREAELARRLGHAVRRHEDRCVGLVRELGEAAGVPVVREEVTRHDRGEARQLADRHPERLATVQVPPLGEVGIGEHDVAVEVEQRARVRDASDGERGAHASLPAATSLIAFSGHAVTHRPQAWQASGFTTNAWRPR